jgi:hypothetical protein
MYWMPLLVTQLALAQTGTVQGEIVVVPDPSGAGHANSNFVAGVGTTLCAYGARGLYSVRPDVYDGVVVFTSSPMSSGLTGNAATPKGTLVRPTSSGSGYGSPLIVLPAANYGSAAQLSQCVFMGPVQNLPPSPDEDFRVASLGGTTPSGLTGIETLGHEYGHHWLVQSAYDQGAGLEVLHRGDTREPLDGQQSNRLSLVTLHYSGLADSQSVMFGNFITPLGGGQYRLSGGSRQYGPMDQYLMGLRAPSETPPMRVLDDGSGMGVAEMPLRRGESKTVSGMAEVWVSVEDVVRAQGPRLPAFPDAKRCFRVAFVLVLAPGATTATPQQLAAVEAYRTRWESWFFGATDGRAATVTTLDPSAACPTPPLPAADVGTESADAGGPAQDAGEPPQDAGAGGQDAGGDEPGTAKLQPGCGCTGAAAAPWLLAFALWTLSPSRRRD